MDTNKHEWAGSDDSFWNRLLSMFDVRRAPTLNVAHQKSDIDLSGVFAVSDQEPWWLAVHQLVDQAELETIAGARRMTADANRCIAAVGAGEGCDLIRAKLKDARERALAGYRDDIKAKA